MKFDEFSKSDLSSGMVLVYRNGELRRLIGIDIYSVTCVTKHSTLSWFNEDLTHKANNEYDIVKVYMPGNNTSKIDYIENEDLDNIFKYELIWERSEPILTDEEREYLAAVIKPFRDRVMYIKFLSDGWDISGYIEIYFASNISIADNIEEDFIVLERVNHNTCYKNMEANRAYTLGELNL